MQIDEIWTYVQKKARRVRKDDSPEVGDAWVFVTIDAETKLIPTFHVGKRYREDTRAFLWDLYGRISGRTQITTDGLHHYRAGVPNAFGLDVDFTQLVKLFGDYGQHDTAEARYSPSPIMEVISKVRTGDPDPKHISDTALLMLRLACALAFLLKPRSTARHLAILPEPGHQRVGDGDLALFPIFWRKLPLRFRFDPDELPGTHVRPTSVAHLSIVHSRHEKKFEEDPIAETGGGKSPYNSSGSYTSGSRST